jgi:rhizosphere induced protein
MNEMDMRNDLLVRSAALLSANSLAAVTYSLRFINNSDMTGDVCVFQQDPGLGPNIIPLAWFAQPAHPSTNIKFQWTIAYDFIWSQTGELQPGITFDASQTWPADLSSINQVTFNYSFGAFTFDDLTTGPRPGSMYILQSASIPPDEASVGIGMSGQGAFAVQARSNIRLSFTPHPTYWIAFGTFTQGEVLDISEMTQAKEVPYITNIYSMTAILNEDHTWTIVKSSQVNADFLRAKAKNAEAKWGRY